MNARLEIVNRLLATATPGGAYCLGLVSGMAEDANVVPSELLLQKAVNCQTREEATELFRVWKELNDPAGKE